MSSLMLFLMHLMIAMNDLIDVPDFGIDFAQRDVVHALQWTTRLCCIALNEVQFDVHLMIVCHMSTCV